MRVSMGAGDPDAETGDEEAGDAKSGEAESGDVETSIIFFYTICSKHVCWQR